ncbi:ABC transporter substrate-binding protein [Desulfomonile tiedjei]|uniref:ABC-type nitrate/sulfonate/bicarbonate transport system, periplasmic component n=1 Tax=Desulfomonile tiedjei (strain ATCC 49306 / DSM 6799 / DCB-1) TaxID=706587 RepID=I4C2I6_DESTA|nr:ABC transporter substrate-binding protein [Desulfomonile tiedjei]AFM23777.1 ABC-type nitrate/sulfonate/bicarbonate transport system, periplasmic component [Desulfomonile tiedjei DSM 6799]
MLTLRHRVGHANLRGAIRNYLLGLWGFFFVLFDMGITAAFFSGFQISEPVSLGSVESEISTPLSVAQEKTFFKRNRVEATITAYKSKTDAASDMLRGKLDKVVIGDFVASRLAVDGNDIQILATLREFGNVKRISMKDRAVNSVYDLKGKRIGLERDLEAERILSPHSSAHMEPEDVLTPDPDPKDQISALEHGEVDATVIFELFDHEIMEKLGSRARIVSTEREELMLGVPIGTEKLTRTKPNPVKNVLTSMVKVKTYVRRNPDDGREIAPKRLSPRVSLYGLEKRSTGSTAEVNVNQALVLTMEGQDQWLTSGRQPATGKLPNLLHFMELEALNHVKPGTVSIIH